MKIRLLIVFSLIAITNSLIFSQTTVRMPLEIAKAYQNGTRSNDGKPGPSYWQNFSDYTITAELHTEESKLSGSESVVYHNNSPDTLSIVTIRLYPDFYKKGNARSWTIGNNDLTDGTLIKKIEIGSTNYDVNNSKEVIRTATNLYVKLSNNILPGDSIVMVIDWEFDIPKKAWARFGNYGNDRFFIAYWYPQIAVYDDIDGWDKVEYYGTVEYYNDFNNFDVSIMMPEGFTVWATGDLQNMDELYTDEVVGKYRLASKSDEVINIFNVEDCQNDKVLKNNGPNTWNFKATKVPDFTFGASKYSNWDATSTIADHSTGRRVFVDAVYPDSVDTFDEGAFYAVEGVNFMVDSLPGYPFPYSHITSFCNGRKSGGMESPMMVNEGDPAESANAIGLIFHEILHSYFPFYMGINERKYAWMDEGWAAWLPYGVLNQLEPDFNYFARISGSFENISGKEKEVPLMYLSYQIKDYASYRVHSYNRSAMAYAYLHNALGDSLFKEALHTFMDRWNGKHPIPYDFFNTFENVTGQDLDWYFQPWFFDRAYADLGVKKVTLDNKIVIENNGGLPLPVIATCKFSDGSQETIYNNSSIWRYGDNAIIIQADTSRVLTEVVLGDNEIPDVVIENNRIIINQD